jgi:hypothetical protein
VNRAVLIGLLDDFPLAIVLADDGSGVGIRLDVQQAVAG